MAVGRFDAVEAALNAVLGDYLARRGNALAIEMTLLHEGALLVPTSEPWRAAHPGGRGKVVVFVHGLGANEGCWSFCPDPHQSYGALLRDELSLTPVYVRYNTGRRISENGLELALRLEALIEHSCVDIEEISLIGHSMGGLVIRSACHHAETLGMSWIRRARRALYLGSPHLGAPLEKAGHMISLVLGAIDDPVVRLTRSVAELRSAGVKDLRMGTLHDGDSPLPLAPSMDHFLVAGTLTGGPNHWIARALGDAMVGVKSATDPGRRAGLPAAHFAVFPGIGHLDLARSPEVYAKIREWFESKDDARVRAADSCREPALSGDPIAKDDRAHWLGRVDAYRELVQDAVENGTTAVQQVHEELASRPYDWIALVPPLGVPANVVRTLHLGAVRGAYGATRSVNRLVGYALREGIAWFRRSATE